MTRRLRPVAAVLLLSVVLAGGCKDQPTPAAAADQPRPPPRSR
ncbi:hypothetical protein ACFQ1L_18635 [Phytohabitans flavus]